MEESFLLLVLQMLMLNPTPAAKLGMEQQIGAFAIALTAFN